MSFINDVLYRMTSIIPENCLKELAIRFYCMCFNPLYSLNKNVSKIAQDGEMLFVELSDGSKFYCSKSVRKSKYLNYGRTDKLNKIKSFVDFGSFLYAIREVYLGDQHEKYYRLKEGDIVVDIGANIGLFTVKAVKAVGASGVVVAIEPEPKNLDMMKRNIQANRLKNIIIVPKGVWSGKGTLKLNLSSYIGEHSFVSKVDSDTFAEAKVDSLDDILRELNIKHVDFIKMDIEGAEVEALRGMDEILRSRVNLAIEAGHIVNGKRTYKFIARELGKINGFKVYTKSDTVYGLKKEE